MNRRNMTRRWVILGLVLGLALFGIAPPAAARKAARPGWESVNFSGNWMWYEAIVGPGTGEDLDWVYIQAFEGDFKLGKRSELRTASVLVAEASGGDCIADDGAFDTETGYVIIGWHVTGAKQVIGDLGDDEFINFQTPRSGSLDTSLTLTGRSYVYEAEYLGPGACNGITVLDEEPIEKSMDDIALSWYSEQTVVEVQKGKNGKVSKQIRWETTTGDASGTLNGVDMGLPFGEGDPDRYWTQSFYRSGSAMIPSATFG